MALPGDPQLTGEAPLLAGFSAFLHGPSIGTPARPLDGVALRGTVAGDDLAIDWAETERLRKGRLAPS